MCARKVFELKSGLRKAMLDAKAVCKKQKGLACDHILCSDLNVKARIQQNAGPLNWSMAGTDGWSQEKTRATR